MLDKKQSASGIAGTLRLKGKDISTRTVLLDQKTLQFYTDNPRIYSLVRSQGRMPDQAEIQKQLQGFTHVQELIQDIKSNEGLTDPIIVRDDDFVVLEGNSRLAAYRFLATKDPIKWNTILCTVLPADIDEKLVFTLLGQYHVKGKKTGHRTKRQASYIAGMWSTRSSCQW
jgi:ParB-like nuclease domain